MQANLPPDETSPIRPYLLRAVLEWIVDNGLTPHLLVNATLPGVSVPQQSVRDGQIVLNIGITAVRNFDMDNDGIRFDARFSGQAMRVVVPIYAAVALYAMENGKGLIFPEEVFSDEETPPPPVTPVDPSPGSRPRKPAGKGGEKRPALRLVK